MARWVGLSFCAVFCLLTVFVCVQYEYHNALVDGVALPDNPRGKLRRMPESEALWRDRYSNEDASLMTGRALTPDEKVSYEAFRNWANDYNAAVYWYRRWFPLVLFFGPMILAFVGFLAFRSRGWQRMTVLSLGGLATFCWLLVAYRLMYADNGSG